MKRKIAMFIILLLLTAVAGCGKSGNMPPSVESIKSYRDIPGITTEEVSAIEKLKFERGSLTFGHLLEMEAIPLSDGTYTSFTSEFCNLFSELFGIELESKSYDSWQDLKMDIDTHRTDFTGDITPTLNLMQDYYITDSIANRMQKIYVLEDSVPIMTEADVEGLRLGFLENSVNIEPILERYPDLSFDLVYVDYISSVEYLLASGLIDAFVSERNLDVFFMNNDRIRSKEFFPLAYTSASLITANPELKPVISVMDKYLAAGGGDKLYSIYKENEYEYAKHRLTKSLTGEELEYLNNLLAHDGVVNVALEHDNYPFSFYNTEKKEFEGIAVDVLNEISSFTDIEFRNITSKDTTWAEILEALKMGEASLVSQLGYSGARSEYFIWSEVPYDRSDYALISKMDYPAVESFQISRLKIGTISGSIYAEMFREWFPDSSSLVEYPTQDNVFDALEKGEIDLVMGAEYMLLTQENYREKSGYIINYRFNSSLESVFGFNKSEKILRSIIDKAQSQVGIETISNYWNGRLFNYSEKISQIRTTYLTIFSAAALAALLAMAFLLWKNKRLSKVMAENSITLSTIYASIPDAIFCKDTEGVYTNCNPSFERHAGMPEAELVGKTYAEVFKERASETAETYGEIDEKVIRNGAMEIVEETVVYPDGSQRLLETLKAPLIRNGTVVGLLGIGRDVTERKEVETRLERIINTAQIAFILTVDGIVIEANEYSKTHIGVKIGDDIRMFYTNPGQRDAIIETAEQNGTASNIVVRFHMAEGGSHRFISSFTYVEYGRRKAYIMWALDVEQDVTRTKQLIVSQQSLAAVLDVLPMPIRIIDLESAEITYVNDSFLELLEYESADEVCGLIITDVMPDVFSNGMSAHDRVAMMIKSEAPTSVEVEYLTKSGRIIEALVVARQIDYMGRRSSVGIIKDLTAEKERARILMEAVEREKEANQTKSLFLANMSHEIRTPMNGIIGMTDILIGEKLSGRQLQYAKDIKVSAESLLEIINDILDLSKISEGKLQITPVDIDLYLMLKNTVSMIRFSARSKGLELIDEIHINSPEYVRVDDVRLKQVLVNLLSNAVKFTKTGHVKFAASIKDGDLLFEVSDTGAGIRQEDIPIIFTAFEQADKRKNRAIKGTGLGLPISRNLVELMGGNIRVESEYGVGTTFYVTVPYVPGDESEVEAVDVEFKYIYAPTAQVLLVDDIQTNLTVGAGLLRMCGITADVALSGLEAIELVQAKDYDIVFMDHMMPEMDGIEAMDQIRKLGGKYLSLPIIALTANAVSESKKFLLESGMDDFLSKPIDKSTLMSMLEKWLPTDKMETSSNSFSEMQSSALSDTLAAMSKLEDIDIALALNRIGGLQDVLETSIRQVMQSIPGKLKSMDMFLSGGDLRGFTIEAHGLKGALANIGAMHHSELAAGLEIASKAENKPLCIEKFIEFADTMESFAEKLKSVFPAENTKDRPRGDDKLLADIAGEAVSLLNDYEAADAMKRLDELNKFTFGEEKDVILGDARSMIEAFKYKKAISLLMKLIEN